MSTIIHPKDYIKDDGFYDLDEMFYKPYSFLKRNNGFHKNQGEDNVICTYIMEWEKHSEYKERLIIEQQMKEELRMVELKYLSMLIDLQDKCKHYPVKYNGKKYCIKCKKEF